MAKKKTPESTPAAPAAPAPAPAAFTPPPAPMSAPNMGSPGMMPQGMGMPGIGMQGMPGMPMPGMMPGMGMPGMGMQGMPQGMGMQGMPQGMGMPGMNQNPMMAMMQAMQQMMSWGAMGGAPGVDPAAVPFAGSSPAPDADKGLDQDIIRPATLSDRVKNQSAVPVGSVLDLLCLTEDGKNALGGIPKGCTIAFAGPPGKGKTRTAIAALANVARTGEKVAFVIAEEGFHDDASSGRDDLCSRFVKIGTAVTGLDEAKFSREVLENVFVLQCQYHKGTSWDDFVAKYRYLVEKEKIRFVVIDSLNMLDPSRNRTADNLSALKTYNHEKGITCLCLGQIRDTGAPVGGEALEHTADAVFLIEEMSLGSKEIAEQWGGKYRDKIDVLHVIKSVTTPRFEAPIRLDRAPGTGILVAHAAQPAEFAVRKPK